MEDCPICAAGAPRDVLRELDCAWVTGGSAAPLPGYLCVVSKRHVVEPYELSEYDRSAFWDACMAVAEALARAVRPKKMNYEIHGNTVAHLHMHLFPRFDGDPFEGRPIDGREATCERTPQQLQALADAIGGS